MPNQNGLDFNFDPPRVIESNSLRGETIGAISNADGALLFYCDGVNIYNRNHDVLPNGSAVATATSSNNGVIFIPDATDPDLIHLYIVNSIGGTQGRRLSYNRIDKSLDGGLGDVLSGYRSVTIGEEYAEGMKAVKGSCGFVWIVLRKVNSKELHAIKVLNGEIVDIVISDILVSDKFLSSPSPPWTVGELDYSTASGLLIVGFADRALELFSFDTETGIVSDPLVLSAGDESPDLRRVTTTAYESVVFTPDGRSVITAIWPTGKEKSIVKFDFNYETKTTSRSIIASYSPSGPTEISRHPIRGDIWLTRGNSS